MTETTYLSKIFQRAYFGANCWVVWCRHTHTFV